MFFFFNFWFSFVLHFCLDGENGGRVEMSGKGQAECMFVNNSGHCLFLHCLICNETGELNFQKKNPSGTDREVCCPSTFFKRILPFVLDPPLSSLIARFRSYGPLPNLSLSLIE